MMLTASFGVFVSCLVATYAWKTCDQVQFCKRLRPKAFTSNYSLDVLSITQNTVFGTLSKTNASSATILVTITAIENDIFRLKIDDAIALKPPRYTIPYALDGIPNLASTSKSQRNHDKIILKNGKGKALIYTAPFKIEIYSNRNLVSIINAKQRLVFENSPPKVSVALDVSFPDAEVAYGLPLHADHLALRTTTKEDPYRLFNVDYYAYKPESTEGLYGSVPVLYAHGTKHTSGIFWLNSAQTWIDIEKFPGYIGSYFMSETGRIDAFILTGPTLQDSVKQYAYLTGVARLPPYFSLGYHQNRYSYMSQEEVIDVVEQFQRSNMPLEVMWLDIDYTLDKKYFTWNPDTFPNPIGLQNYLLKCGKKLVVIIDAHFKNETGYFLHDEAIKNGYYIRNPDGSHYIGVCFPGPSAYLDFTNEKALNYYASLYETLDTFQGEGIHIWNDMNEPAVFYTIPTEIEEYEKTVPLNTLHFNDYEHRDIHNIYGFLQTIGTKKGMLARPGNTRRPFILTRSHFAGSQRYAAIWTGDIYASWDHLKISIPMCLTEALSGISFCGADVGGFVGVPSDELFQRWYQVGAWLPFYRGHSDAYVPRREPYRFSAEIQEQVRKSLNQRYAHLPVWYTLFYEHERNGEPVLRPISYHYPKELNAIAIDTQFLIGSDILVAPVLIEGLNISHIYLPGGMNEIWYNIEENFTSYEGTGYHTFKVNIASTPIFYRGGGIITRKDTPRLSSVETYGDPFTIYIAPDTRGSAKGRMYIDDYESFEYKKSKQYVYNELGFSNDKVTLSLIDTSNYKGASNISTIVILNSPKIYVHAKLLDDNIDLSVSYNFNDRTVTISNCSLKPHVPFEIELS